MRVTVDLQLAKPVIVAVMRSKLKTKETLLGGTVLVRKKMITNFLNFMHLNTPVKT